MGKTGENRQLHKFGRSVIWENTKQRKKKIHKKSKSSEEEMRNCEASAEREGKLREGSWWGGTPLQLLSRSMQSLGRSKEGKGERRWKKERQPEEPNLSK